MNKAEQYSWQFVLEKGKVVGEWSYYGAAYNEGDTGYCRKAISMHGINWKKTKPVQDDILDSFMGTFTEETYKHIIMRGKLVTNDGKEWEWAVVDVAATDLIEFLASYLPDIKG